MAYVVGFHQNAQIVYGTKFQGQITIPAGTGIVPGGPTVTIVPRTTGAYKMTFEDSQYAASGDLQFQIVATVGSPVWFNQTSQLSQAAALEPAHLEVRGILTAGVTYTFAIQYIGSVSGFFLAESVDGFGISLVAEQIL